MRKLCLDLGTKTCGFAISDELGIISTGLENFFFKERKFSEIINKVKEYLNLPDYKNKIDAIILGYPLRMDLSKSERTLMVENFKLMLEKEITLPIIYQDERQSTINAENILMQANYSKQKRKQKKDSLAAQLILESYLERKQNENRKN